MFHYGHGGQMHRKPNSCDADPVSLTHVSQNGQRSKSLRRVFQKSFKRHMDLFSEDLAFCTAGDHSRPHCILARRCKQSASISNSRKGRLIFLPDIQAGSKLILILPSSSRAKFHARSTDLLSRCVRCASEALCLSLTSFPGTDPSSAIHRRSLFPDETISPE